MDRSLARIAAGDSERNRLPVCASIRAPRTSFVIVQSLLRLLLAPVLILAFATTGSAAAPTLSHLFPAGGQRGTKVVVECSGTFDWPAQVSAPGIEVVPLPDKGKLEITIPPDILTDRVWLRLYNAEGASATAPFLIGGLPELNEVEPNDRISKSQSIEKPLVTINGILKDADVDCFGIHLEAGQTLVAAVDANSRLGSPMDAILQVVSDQGNVLIENHDNPRLDPRLTFTPTKSGTYTVRLFAFSSAPNTAIRFSGGPNFVYRLTLTTGSYVTNTVPLSASLMDPRPVGVAGWNLPGDLKLNVTPLFGSHEWREHEPLDDLRRSSAAEIGFAASADFQLTTRCRLTPFPAVIKQTIQPGPEPAPIPIPCAATGLIQTRKQTDLYTISLMKGQAIVATAESRSLDLPLDLVIRMQNAEGGTISEADDTAGTRDAAIAFTAPQDGQYRIAVTDRFRQGHERGWYLLTVRPDEPDVELSVANDTITVATDKPTEVAIKVVRRGIPANSIGAISITATGLPEGTTAAPVVSEATGPTATEVKLSITSSGPGFNGPIRITGRCASPKEFERNVHTPAKLGVTFETLWLTVIAK